jgi:hypothetical protein
VKSATRYRCFATDEDGERDAEYAEDGDGDWAEYAEVVRLLSERDAEITRLLAVEAAAREYIRYLDNGDLVTHGGTFRRDAIRHALGRTKD